MTHNHVQWPRKLDLFGVQVSATTYDEVVQATLETAERNQSALVTAHAVHAIVCAATNRGLRNKINQFDAVCPDGQPVRWSLNWLYKTGLRDRVYGPELMRCMLKACAASKVPVYFYGSTPEVIDQLNNSLSKAFPDLEIAGSESPPFRKLSEEEKVATANRINESGAKVVFVGLGAPKQDEVAFEFRGSVNAVLVCVGAAFDFHAGNKKMAPGWMQKLGLEWFFRLGCEPRRLFWRYLSTNSVFLWKLFGYTCLKLVGKIPAKQESSA